MKKIFILLLCLFSFYQINAQHNTNSPWMRDLQNKSSKKNLTLAEISTKFNTYWKINEADKTKKGSGFKPFKRWENRWKLSLDKNGMITTPDKIWGAWKEKNKLQTKSTNDFSNWQNIGPFTQESKSGQGRINTIIVDPKNTNTYYVGAPAGGIWKSTDSGTTWNPLSDYLPQIGVSGIAIDPNNSEIIYIATGDDDAYDTYSIGVLKSTDGGNTWNTTGLQFTDSFSASNEIYTHPTNSNILWVATSKGVYKTIDAGVTWNLKLAGNIRDLKIKPNDFNTIYAVSSSQFYKSTDGGDNFTNSNIGLPASSSRLAIEVTPANNNLVYVLSANDDNDGSFQGLYKSTNSGNFFSKTNENDDIFGGSKQSWYDMSLTVSDTNENIVLVGVVDLWKSTNGGDNFTQLNNWFDPTEASYTHADIHFLRYYNGALFCGSDGGIYKSTNDGTNFNELNESLVISQYYRIATSRQTANNIAGGLQDNGGFAYSNNTWYNYHGGDGMDCVVDPNNPTSYYGFTQYGGSLNVTYNGGVTGQGVVEAPETGNWITPLVINSQSNIYAGFSHLYKLDNSSWQQVSEDVFGGKISHIEIDPNNNTIIYVSNSKRLYKSTDSGVNFSLVYTANNDISSIEVNNGNSNLIYLTASGESGDVLKSIDGGTNFTSITANLPSESKLIIKHQPHSSINDLYVGTTLGVYHTNDNMANWEVFSNNLPNVPIRDLEININDKVITAGTYGRGVWQSAIEVIPPSNDIQLITINNPNNNYSCNAIIPQIVVKNEGQNVISQVNINYRIDNTDFSHTFNGTINSQASQTITLPSITGLSLGKHQISVETTISNDAYSDNNNFYSAFYVNNFSNTPTTVNPFETSSDAWLVTGSDLWEIDTPTTSLLSASNNKGYVTNATGNYPNNTSSYLVSPCYDLSQITNPILKFDMAFDIEENWDVLYMEYTTDNGATWEVLGTANDPNWYNSNYDANQLTIGKQWSGTVSVFTPYSYDLTALTNEVNISFRFAFLTDQLENNEGVLIDNFVIEGNVTASTNNTIFNGFQIYPNPSNGLFTVKRRTSKPMQITIFDITGKSIYKLANISDTNYTLDLTAIEKGIYFATITIDDTSEIRKLILK